MNTLSIVKGVVTLALIGLFAGGVLFAYRSPALAKGDFLYPVRRTTENLLRVTADPGIESVTFLSRMAVRRAHEAVVLVTRVSVSDSFPARAQGTPIAYAAVGPEPDEITEPLAETVVESVQTIEEAMSLLARISAVEERTTATHILADANTKIGTSFITVAGSTTTDTDPATVIVIEKAMEATVENRESLTLAAEEVTTAAGRGETGINADIPTSSLIQRQRRSVLTITDAQQLLADTRAAINAFESMLTANGITDEEAARLAAHIQTKRDYAEAAFEEGNYVAMRGLLRAVRALTNNARHFTAGTAPRPLEEANTALPDRPGLREEIRALRDKARAERNAVRNAVEQGVR